MGNAFSYVLPYFKMHLYACFCKELILKCFLKHFTSIQLSAMQWANTENPTANQTRGFLAPVGSFPRSGQIGQK